MKRYEQGSAGMRPDPEGLWCDYTEAKQEIERLREEATQLRQALGVLTTLHPTMEIDVNNPVQMALEIVSYVTESNDAEIERLRGLLREGLGQHVRLHVHPHFPAWEKRVREALGDER